MFSRFPFSFYLATTLFHMELSKNYNQKKILLLLTVRTGENIGEHAQMSIHNMTASQQLHAADAAYDAALAARKAARDSAELAACQRLLPLLQPDHLAALARNAAAHGISTSDVSAIGFLAQPENCVTGAVEKTLAPVARKYRELLKEENQKAGLAALDTALDRALEARTAARALPENVATEAAAVAARKADQYSPHIGGGFADDGMYLH